MDSKKLGMFAAAALTVLAAQANAGDKKATPAAAKASGEMECVGTCAPNCGGKVREGVKDEAACTTAKGNWTAKTAKAETPKAGKAENKAHDHHK